MSADSLGQSERELESRSPTWLDDWLPSRQQMANALQLQFDPPRPIVVADAADRATAVNEWADPPDSIVSDNVWAISMRQGMGLVIVMALIAGVIPFLFNWVQAGRVGTVLPLAEFAQVAQRNQTEVMGVPGEFFWETGLTIAGLKPALFPGWLAAGLSALGEWLNGAIRWLTFWLVYGVGVLLAAKLLGAQTTLQRFYALTAYGAIPLVLTGLAPIPCLGVIASGIAGIWAFVVYVMAVRSVTGMSLGYAAVSVILPGAVAFLVSALVVLSFISTIMGLIF